MKIKIKEAYLLVLIVLGLVSLSVYSTYALFTKEVTIDNVVSFNTSISLSDSNLVEYELVTLNPNETKIIELRVSNSSTSSLYYGCWYELLTTNNNVSVGVYTEKNNTPASGTLDTSATKTILLGVVNNSISTTLVNIGVVGSTTENLGLSSSRTLVTDTYSPYILVTDEVLAANTTTTTTTETVTQEFTEAKSYETTLGKGTHTLEAWGAQGGSYSTYLGGKGGYSKGTITLTEDTTAFVYVGGQPATVDANMTVVAGGFNGGGNGYNRHDYYEDTYTYGQGGGGASDIRLGTDSLYARVIVAGGGGGSASADGSAKYGGGTTGGSAQSGYGASQTSAGTNGSFGQGGSATTSGDYGGYGSGGGGGGWYGGGASSSYSDYTNYQSYNGGGSGYVYTADTATNYPSGCLLNSSYYLTNAATYGGNTSFTDFDGSAVTGHSGNGAVKITGPKITTVTTYQIPRILGLKVLNVKVGTSKDLESGVTYECETGSSSCTYLGIGSEITDTSTLELGTYIVKYKIKGLDNKVYVYERTIIVRDEMPANSPDLIQGLIPVVYDSSTSTWVKADTTSSTSTYVWYDYDQKKWANAVLVTSTNRSVYQSVSAGTTIQDADILAFYVWIPRYKYKVWNKDKVIGTQSYNAQTTGIDIVFESGTDSTGTINCTSYSYYGPSSSAGSPNETCTGSNGDYYTHPAFTFGSQELTGFWMGKFELSSSSPATGSYYGGGTSITLTPRILPNVTSWRHNTISNYWKVIYDMQKESNIYGLPTSRTNVDSHMLTNMEWGAVAYLTNSKYGRCTNGSCTEVSRNGYGEDNHTTMTGCGPISSGSTSYGATCNAYNTTLGQTASTTGNIYGVYDMSGGANEYVMGNMSSSMGTTYTYNASSAGTNFTYSTDTAKYLVPYANGERSHDQSAYNRARLGDATGEVVLTADYLKGGWYNVSSSFLSQGYSGDESWFDRGGSFEFDAGPFSFTNHFGSSDVGCSSRAALAIVN